MSKRAIIFDFDGTIADSFPAVLEVFEDLTKQPRKLTKDDIARLRNSSGPELMKVFNVPKWKVPYLFFRGRRMMRDHMQDVGPQKGVGEIIRHLHALGVPLYIVSSNSTENIHAYLKKYDLEQYFSDVYGSASAFAKARKILKVIDAEGIDTVGSWYVGDETRDVSAAHAVGLKIASVSWGYNGRESLEAKHPDALVDTPVQLRKVLEAAWKK